MDKVNPIITSIPEKLEKTEKIISKGNSLGMLDAMKLGRQSNGIVSTIKKATAAYEGFQPNAQEAQTLLEEMTRLVEATESQLSLLVENKAAFDALWVSGIVKRNTANLQNASEELSKAMMAVCPEDLKAQTQELETRRKTAFDKAMAAYGNATGGEDKEDPGEE